MPLWEYELNVGRVVCESLKMTCRIISVRHLREVKRRMLVGEVVTVYAIARIRTGLLTELSQYVRAVAREILRGRQGHLGGYFGQKKPVLVWICYDRLYKLAVGTFPVVVGFVGPITYVDTRKRSRSIWSNICLRMKESAAATSVELC